MGASIPCCGLNEGLGNCPCEECNKFLTKSDAFDIVLKHIRGEGRPIGHWQPRYNICGTSMLEEMQQKLISIAEDFDKWLEEMAKKYNMPKDEIQALIKQFLIGL